MGTPQIMLRDMSDLDGIFSSYITGVISIGLLIEYECNMCGHAELSQYEILSLFIRYSVYSGIKKHDIELYKGDTIYVLCSIYTHDRHHRKISSNHMTFSSLG
jgi:hypothetical protein